MKHTNIQTRTMRWCWKAGIFQLLMIAVSLVMAAACQNSRKPGLSDNELFAQQKVEPVKQLKQETDFFEMETYVVPPGIKYAESRAVDPAHPPVVLDIANRNLNIKKFDLSDYYASVRYVKLKYPKPATEGNFLFDANYSIYLPVRGIRGGAGFNSLFKFSDDFIIAGDFIFGLHCYDKEGKYVHTVESNDFPKKYDPAQNMISYNEIDFKGFNGRMVTTNGNHCLYLVREDNTNKVCLYELSQKKRTITLPFKGSAFFVDNTSIAGYVYSLTDSVTGNFLFTFDLKGDTLCRFVNYNTLPKLKKTASLLAAPSPDIYYHRDLLTLRQSMNDTVYRMAAPNRLIPAYVLNFGPYRIDVQTYLYGNQSGKLLAYTWKESDRYVLFVYTQGRDTHDNREKGLVQFFYSYFDKKSRQFYHFSEGSTIPEQEFFMENPLPDALPFILSHAEIQDSQLQVCYSKKRLEAICKNKGFASLSPEQQNKLKTLQNELDDSEVLIMILE